MNTLLVPVDFSPVSRFVVSAATKLARPSKSRLVLLHVVQPPAIVTDYGPVIEDASLFTVAAEKAGARQLARLKKKLRTAGFTVETLLKVGGPVFHILDQARKRSVSHIVLGSHGHTAFYDLLIGSTASGVIKRAKCPVVVVPPPAKAR